MKSKKLLLLAIIGIATFMVAFRSPAGGEGFEIYIDNKLLVQKFNADMKKLTNLQLSAASSKSNLSVKFYHCGMVGTNRMLLLKDADHRLLKQWQFSNTGAKNYAISIPVSEILELHKKAKTGTVYLFYSSKETAEAKFLAGIINNNKKTAAAK